MLHTVEPCCPSPHICRFPQLAIAPRQQPQRSRSTHFTCCGLPLTSAGSRSWPLHPGSNPSAHAPHTSPAVAFPSPLQVPAADHCTRGNHHSAALPAQVPAGRLLSRPARVPRAAEVPLPPLQPGSVPAAVLVPLATFKPSAECLLRYPLHHLLHFVWWLWQCSPGCGLQVRQSWPTMGCTNVCCNARFPLIIMIISFCRLQCSTSRRDAYECIWSLLCCAGWGIGFTPLHVYRLMAQVGRGLWVVAARIAQLAWP